MSVLAHVVYNGPMANEPAATQALHYILTSSDDTARAFLEMLHPAGIKFEHGDIWSETGDAESRPDLTIQDKKGEIRILVENKFWAGLTEAQPVRYLGQLPEDGPSALLFIVPIFRRDEVWGKIKSRCQEAGIVCGDDNSQDGLRWMEIHPQKKILITSWRYMLDQLLNNCDSGRDDIIQLKGLIETVNDDWRPFENHELNKVNLGRLKDYRNLIDNVTEKLKERKIADTKGLNRFTIKGEPGRYLKLHDKFDVGLIIRSGLCSKSGGITIFWCYCYKGKVSKSGLEGQLQKIPSVFKDALAVGKDVYIPIRLKANVDIDKNSEDAAKQIIDIADKLKEMTADHDG